MSEGFRYTREWRWTRMGAITYPVGICLVCKAVVEPVRVRTSRAGTHGEWFYVHEHPLYFIELLESNNGQRSVKHDPEVAALAEAARGAWELGASEREVEDLIRGLL
ncbi:MAG: hypothetical protein QXW40_08210, partial [Thermofilum sp.]